MNIEHYYILCAFGNIEERKERWSVSNLQKKLREDGHIKGLSSRDKLVEMVNQMVCAGMSIRKFDTLLDPKERKRLKKEKWRMQKKDYFFKADTTREERAILEAYKKIQEEKSIWSQNNLEKKLRELNMTAGLTDRDKRRILVEKMVDKGLEIRKFDTHSGLEEKYNGEKLF